MIQVFIVCHFVSSVDRAIYINCKPHLFLSNGKEEITLTPAQIRDVNAIEFFGLLKVKCGKMPSSIIPFLVAHFDRVNRIQNIPNNRGYVINPNDAFDIFGLPLYPTNHIKIKAPTHENSYDAWVKTLGFLIQTR